jgi:hypothetical protein
MSENRHQNYEILNLLGYGLAKFNIDFVRRFGFKTKTAFYDYIVALDIAETPGVVKNRQDLFDPFFSNDRRGWWQKGDAYIHRKLLIDSLFGDLDVSQYVTVIKLYIEEKFGVGASTSSKKIVSPVIKSKFKQLQLTGRAAELHFMNNYNDIESFATGIIDDGRLYGDGYDFQVEVSGKYYLAEIKGVRGLSGSVRLTENEFLKASEFQNNYALVIVSKLDDLPKMTTVFNPIVNLTLTEKVMTQSQRTYHSEFLSW